MTRSILGLAVFILIACAAPAWAAQNDGGGPKGVTIGDLVDRGFVCKPFGDGMMHCTNPDDSVPDWVCYPNQICTPGKPRLAPSLRLPRNLSRNIQGLN